QPGANVTHLVDSPPVTLTPSGRLHELGDVRARGRLKISGLKS
ncbi:MAG: hypothetical protein ACJAYX_004845, partial [Planctomycetota bacterium]